MRGKTTLSFAACLVFALSISTSHAALVLNPAASITHAVTVQPVIVSNDDGSNQATYFGNATQQASILGFVDDIWAQAGIDVTFLSPNFWNNSFANEGNLSPRPTTDLATIRSEGIVAGVANADSSVINMYLVNVVPGFEALDEDFAAGLATLDGNGFTQFVGANLLTFTTGQEVIASVVAHEIGHNLGLSHNLINENLMESGAAVGGERLNASQIANVLDSSLVTPVAVPIPAAIWLVASALIGLLSARRKSHGFSRSTPVLA
ncbi:MAG: zinc-dependent metalloprotease family protein [Gammaproteobacteria bacterium]